MTTATDTDNPLLFVDDMLDYVNHGDDRERFTAGWLKRRLARSEWADRRQYLGRHLVMRRSDFEAFLASLLTTRTPPEAP